MALSSLARKKINAFAAEMVTEGVPAEELSYPERFTRKIHETQAKISKKLTSDRSADVAELSGYMSDYMETLMHDEHLSEADAYEKAAATFTADMRAAGSTTDEAALATAHSEYYRTMDPETTERIGLGYASGLLFGIALGAVLGILGQAWYNHAVFGIVFGVVLAAGAVAGLAYGMRVQITARNHRE
ncbi:MAG: hypothetical protein LKJ47_01720 [Bifidobacteriaceae bacterium]|nr:hypothetical protein [Bifidobacteriaceae bacterium]